MDSLSDTQNSDSIAGRGKKVVEEDVGELGYEFEEDGEEENLEFGEEIGPPEGEEELDLGEEAPSPKEGAGEPVLEDESGTEKRGKEKKE